MSDFGLKDIKQPLKLPNISLVLAGGIPQKPEEHSGKTYVRYIEEMRGEIQKEICLYCQLYCIMVCVTEAKEKEEDKMIDLMKKNDVRKLAIVAVAMVIMILSMTVLSKAASDPGNHKKTIESLDEKKADVLKLTASTAAAATAIAAIPGDSTTPVANKLADMTSYFLVIQMVIFLEKYLVTLTGYAAFFILIPAACILFAAGICLNKTFLKALAAKTAVFGIVIYMIIPLSMKVSSMIEETYESTMETTVKEAQDIADEINDNTDSEGNIIDKFLSKLKDGVSGLMKKGEKLLNQFIEVVAVMMVTSCLIPIVVLLFMIWFVRVLFGVQINVPKELPNRFKKTGKRKINNLID